MKLIEQYEEIRSLICLKKKENLIVHSTLSTINNEIDYVFIEVQNENTPDKRMHFVVFNKTGNVKWSIGN